MAEAKASAASIFSSLATRLDRLDRLMQGYQKRGDEARVAAIKSRISQAHGELQQLQNQMQGERRELEKNGGDADSLRQIETELLKIQQAIKSRQAGDPNDPFAAHNYISHKGDRFVTEFLELPKTGLSGSTYDASTASIFPTSSMSDEFFRKSGQVVTSVGSSNPRASDVLVKNLRRTHGRAIASLYRRKDSGVDVNGYVGDAPHPVSAAYANLTNDAKAIAERAAVNKAAEKYAQNLGSLRAAEETSDIMSSLGVKPKDAKTLASLGAKVIRSGSKLTSAVTEHYGSTSGQQAQQKLGDVESDLRDRIAARVKAEQEEAAQRGAEKSAAVLNAYKMRAAKYRAGVETRQEQLGQRQEYAEYQGGEKLGVKNFKSMMSRDMAEKRYEDKAGQELYRAQYGVSDRVGGKLARIEAARSLAEESTGSVSGALKHQGNVEMVALLKELVNIEKERGKLEKDNSSGQHNKAIEVLNQQRQSILTGVGPAQASLAKNGIQAFANKGIMGALGNIPVVGGALAGAFGGIASAGGIGAAIAGGGAAGIGAAALGALGLVAGTLAASAAAYNIGGAAREEEIQGYNVGNKLGTNGRLIDQLRPGMGAASEAFKRLGYKSSELMDFQANANIYGMSSAGQGKLAIAGGNLARQTGMGLDTTAALASSFNRASGRSSDSSNVRDLFDMFASSFEKGIKNGLGMGGEELANVIKGTFDQVSQNAGGYLDKGVQSNLIGSLQAAMPGDSATAANRVQRMAKIQAGIQQSEDAGLLGAINERVKREMRSSGKSFADIAAPDRSAAEKKRLNEIYAQNSYLGVDMAKSMGGLNQQFGAAINGIAGGNYNSQVQGLMASGLSKGDAYASLLGNEDLLSKLGTKATKGKADVDAAPQSSNKLGKGSVIQELQANEIKITGSKIVLVGTMPFVSGVQDAVTKSYGELNKAAQSFNGGANSFGEWVDKLVKLVLPGTPAPTTPKTTSFLGGSGGYGDGKYAPRGGSGIVFVGNQSSSGTNYGSYASSTGTTTYTAPPSTGGGTTTLPGGQKIKLTPGAPLPNLPLPGAGGTPGASTSAFNNKLVATAKDGITTSAAWMTATVGEQCSMWARQVVEKSIGLASGTLAGSTLFGSTAQRTYQNFAKYGVTKTIAQGLSDKSLTAGDLLFRNDGPGKDGKYGTADDPAGHVDIMGENGMVYGNFGKAGDKNARSARRFDPKNYTNFADMEAFNSRYMVDPNGQVTPRRTPGNNNVSMAPIKIDVSGNIKVDGIDDPALKKIFVTQLMPTIRAQVSRMRA